MYLVLAREVVRAHEADAAFCRSAARNEHAEWHTDKEQHGKLFCVPELGLLARLCHLHVVAVVLGPKQKLEAVYPLYETNPTTIVTSMKPWFEHVKGHTE
jgi:hypothetical protein